MKQKNKKTIVRKFNKKQAGFTLVEILVAVAIFAAFMVVSVDSFVNILRIENKTNVLRKTQEDIRYILESITRDARNANGEIDTTGARVSHAYATNLPAGDSLTITSTSGGVVTRTIYSLSDGVLSKEVLGNSPISLNDKGSVKITKFSIAVDFPSNCPSSDMKCPPKVNIKINSESGETAVSGRADFIAKTELESSATPRNY